LSEPWLVKLAKAQASNSLNVDRRAGLWKALAHKSDKPRPLFDATEVIHILTSQIVDMIKLTRRLRSQSRDFR
jgi:hypothetical protein